MTKLEALAREACVTVEWLRDYLREQIEYRRQLQNVLLARVRRQA